MKTFYKSFFKYLYFSFADIVFIAVLVISIMNDDSSGGFQFSFGEVYLIFGTPLYFVLRGVLSRLVLKKILLPNVVLFISFWFGLPIVSGAIDVLEGLFIATVTSLVSLFSASITNGILRIKNKTTLNNK